MQVTYERIFMECTGDRLHAAVSGALQFSRIGNATPVMQGIANNARAGAPRKEVTAERHVHAKIRRPGRPGSKSGRVTEGARCIDVRFTVSRNALRGAPSGTSTGIGTFATSSRSDLVSIADRLNYAALFQLR